MKISVCMAAYNGESCIKKQIESILPQLSFDDELVIVDDCSTDKTIAVVQGLADNRIRLYRNSYNLGFLKSFEKSICLATGEVVFLSDQDDIWLDDKVKKVMEVLINEDADIVMHDAVIVDQSGKTIFSSLKNVRKISTSPFRNFTKNTFTGCCMAFRTSIREKILPFPPLAIYHDRWIAIIGGLLGMKIKFLDEPLIYYVRHGGNVSPMKKRQLVLVLKDRIMLLKAIVEYIMLKKYNKGKTN